jgi:hypothetical protein
MEAGIDVCLRAKNHGYAGSHGRCETCVSRCDIQVQGRIAPEQIMDHSSNIFAVYSILQSAPEHWTLEKIVALCANLAVIGALLVAAYQMKIMSGQLTDSRVAAKVSRSLDFSRRWNDLEFVKFRAPIYILLLKTPKPALAEIQAAIENNADLKSGLRLVLNFYEEMGLVYNRNQADREMLRSAFAEQITTLCDRAKPYIDFRRSTQPDLWEELMKMNANVLVKK